MHVHTLYILDIHTYVYTCVYAVYITHTHIYVYMFGIYKGNGQFLTALVQNAGVQRQNAALTL